MKSDHQASGGLSAFALRNPHLVVVGCLLVLILGTLALISLPKDLLPSANLPAVQILSFYSGMPVEHVEKNLTSRFERYTGQAIGIERQESKSLVGVSVVKNFFGPETDLNTAISQTTSLVMSVLRRLPPGTQPPLILPFDPMAAVPLALVAVSGDATEKDLYDTARYDVRNTIQAVTGAMAPTVMGGSERQVVVYLDPAKLRRMNLSALDVIERLGHLNTFIPSGNVKIGDIDYQILSNGLVDKIPDMDHFPIRSENGVAVYLKDVGHATDASKIQTNIVRVDGKRQVYVPIYRQPGANSIQVVDQIREAMKALQKRLGNRTLRLVADQSSFIRHAIESITEEALIGGGLAALMVFLFLGNPRATVGVLLSLPLSLLCAFLGLKTAGQTVNAMTLGGLALAIGVLVDNSIVVLENVIRRLASGESPAVAAAEGASEVAMPVLASTLATMVVFFPVVFLKGITKTLFSALAKSVIFAMIGSYLCALVVIPLFAARFLRAKPKDSGRTFILTAIEERIARFSDFYGRRLDWALRHGKSVLAATAIVLTAAATLSVFHVGTELFPRADAGNFVVELRLPSGTRVEETEKFSAGFEDRLRKLIPPHDLAMIITNAGVYYGFPAAFTPNSGPQDVFFNVELTDDRTHTSQEYAKIVREVVAKEYPGTELGIELGGLLTSALNGALRSPIDIQFQGPSQEKSAEFASELARKIKELPGAVDVRVQQRFDAPQITLNVDRDKAGELGVSTDEVVKNVVSAVSGSATFNPSIWVDPKSGIDYLLGVQFHENEVSTLDEFSDIPISGRRQERTIPLHDIASITKTKGPSEINHLNLKPVIDVFLDAEGRDVGGLSGDVDRLIRKTSLPEGYTATIRGEVSEMRSAVNSLGGGFLLAAVLVYLILVVQFRSFMIPAVVMITVPMGLVGIVVMLAATHTYFSIQAAIGAIFMIGIAVANGVLLIEFIIHHVREKELRVGIIEASKARLRPILMTSLASILGLVPMAIGLGHGAEANIPLGRSVIGGQLLSTTLTLFIVPILFQMIHRRSVKKVASGLNVGVLVVAIVGLLVETGFGAKSARADEIRLDTILREAEANDHRISAGEAARIATESGVSSAEAAYYPRLDFEAIDSTGFPGSTGALGVTGLMGSPYRKGMAAGLVAQANLWDFGRTTHAVRAAKYDASAQAEEIRLTVLDTDLEAAHLFFACVRDRSQSENWKFVLGEAKIVSEEVGKYVKTGQRSVVDRYLAESQVEEALTGQADYTERMRLALRRIGILTGTDFSRATCPVVESVRDVPGRTLPGASTHPFIATAQDRAQAEAERAKQARAGNYPRLVAVGSFGALENTRLVAKNDYSVGVGVILPLFDGLRTTSDIHRAEALSAERGFLVEAERERIEQTNAKYDEIVEGARARLTHLEPELKLAREGFGVAKSRYLKFQGLLVDVREALRNLSRTEVQYDEAEVDLLEGEVAKAIFNGGTVNSSGR
jgi:multidrug efflux pump subunit AcrB/outer membrane protein TolC